MPLVSVIVPFYNVERYAAACLESLLVQRNPPSYEIICIDDGSTDGTAELLDGYAARHAVVRVYRFGNEGLSVARNRGVSLARAKLVTFVDGDDLVSPDYLRTLYDALVYEQAEFAQVGYVTVAQEGLAGIDWARECQARPACVRRTFAGTDIKRAYLDDSFRHMAWGSLARRDLYEEVPFVPGALFEDVLCMPDLMERVNRAVLVDEHHYAYVRRGGSLSNPSVMSEQVPRAYLQAIAHVQKVIDTWPVELRHLGCWHIACLHISAGNYSTRLDDRSAALRLLGEGSAYVRVHWRDVMRARHECTHTRQLLLRLALLAHSPRAYLFAVRMYRRMRCGNPTTGRV